MKKIRYSISKSGVSITRCKYRDNLKYIDDYRFPELPKFIMVGGKTCRNCRYNTGSNANKHFVKCNYRKMYEDDGFPWGWLLGIVIFFLSISIAINTSIKEGQKIQYKCLVHYVDGGNKVVEIISVTPPEVGFSENSGYYLGYNICDKIYSVSRVEILEKDSVK